MSVSTGLNIRTDSIRLSFPLNLYVRNASVTDAQDTLLFFSRLDAGIRLLPLLRCEIVPTRSVFLENARFNTGALIEGMEIGGIADSLRLNIGRIDLRKAALAPEDLLLAGADVTLRIDSIPQSESDTPANLLLAPDKIHLKRVSFHYRMPSDSIRADSFFEDILVTGVSLDLGGGRYAVRECTVSGGRADFDVGEKRAKDGFDASHVSLSGIHARMDSLLYCDTEMNVVLRRFSVRERSGAEIVSMEGRLRGDSTTVVVPRLSLQTPCSQLSVQVDATRQSAATHSQGNLRASLTASIDRRDVAILTGKASEEYLPAAPLTCTALLEGNTERLDIVKLHGGLPGVFRIDASGFVEKISDPAARSGSIALTASTYDTKALQAFMPHVSDGKVRLPDDLQLELKTTLNHGEYHAEMRLAEQQQEKVFFDGRYNPARQTYSAVIKIDSLEPVRFLPGDSVMRLTASLHAEGKGTNPFAPSTWTQFDGELSEIHYKDAVMTDVSFGGSLKDSRMQATIRSLYPYLKGDVALEGTIRGKDISGILIANVDSLNLLKARPAEHPFTHSFQIFSEFETDLDKRFKSDITLGNWEMKIRHQTLRPKTLTLHAESREDRATVSFHTGDLSIMLHGDADLGAIAKDLGAVSTDVMQQLKTDTALDLSRLRRLFPRMTLNVEAKRDNPVYNYMQENNIFFSCIALDASLSPENGLQMDASLYNFINDTTKIDTVQLKIRQDSTALKYTGTVVKNKFRNQEPFGATVTGKLRDNTADAEIMYRNKLGETGLHVGVDVRKMSSGFALRIFPERLVLAFLPFRVNTDNYIHIKSLSDISANLQLDGENEASMHLRSLEENGVMHELSLEINRINLSKIFGNRSGAPLMQGIANFSLRYVPTDNTYMLVADAGIDNLFYRNERIGEVLLNGVYLPADSDEHRIDVHCFHDRKEISSLAVLYHPSKQSGRLSGAWMINGAPLSICNPFLENSIRLNGTLQGNIDIAGSENAPLLNGFVQLDTATAYIAAAGTQIRLDGQKVGIKDSKISFDKYNLFASGNNPFVIDGVVDMSNPKKGIADLTLTANDMQLLNAPKTHESIIYGKMVVNLNSTVKGPLNALKMRGNLYLQGSTNMSYILKESPLTASDRMADLITFSYFRDTIPRRQRQSLMDRMPREFAATVGGSDMLLTIHVAPAAKLKIDFNETGNDRIELKGGGDLSLQYTPQGEILLTGRYTFSDGLIKYNMPVISNKTLNIKENSYIEWTGNPFDPYLNLKATERIRASVSTDGQTSHIVNFEAGIALKQRIYDLNLQFTLDAPDDVAVQNQLAAMGAEERSKQAVSILLTGMYLASDGTGRTKLDMNTALNTFLQSEINQITSSLLKDVDFNFGMESFDNMTGTGRRTNYSFRFSKRFYDDRFNIILGGQVSTGATSDEYNSMFINDASIEYRLDTEGNRYTKLFYNRKYDSLLEGEISRYGAGIVFRKKIRRLGDLFFFRKKKTEVITENRHDETNK
ncbi:MAG: translocation/assembly module TamB [Tannerella sp.]|nr:translocation/assembly module TamB [Tannerella sp.]